MNSNIAIITTVINKELYNNSSQFFPQNIQKYVIDGSNGMHGLDSINFMMNMLKGSEIDWLVMADEDVLFQNSNLIFEIIKKMELENYSICGCRDGGEISHRIYNPYVINTFFSILNFKEIEKIWNGNEVKKNQYINEYEFCDDLSKLSFKYDVSSLYEPYYCYYLWLRRKQKKILFLETRHPFKEDQITNAVYFENQIVFFHTWYARSYGVNLKHTERINKVLALINNVAINPNKPKVFKHSTFFILKKWRKLKQKFLMKMDLILNSK